MSPEQVFELKEKVATLQNQILTAHPEMPMLLRKIHTQVLSDPELVTVLSEEDIGIIVQGLSIHTKVEIAAKPEKKETAASIIKKALATAKKGGSVADLF